MMNPKTITIIDSFSIKGQGILTKLQHQENGIPPGTIFIDPTSGNRWRVKKRMLSGILLLDESEVYFDCETEVDHVRARYETESARREAIENEIADREKGIYWYMLAGFENTTKPEQGLILEIQDV